MFANPNGGDYHLKSQAGRWDEVSETWVIGDVTRCCIDAGDPDDPIDEEPYPNGGVVNMGSQFTSIEFTKVLLDAGVQISMDGKGRVFDNIFSSVTN